jgi:hypothetical protein
MSMYGYKRGYEGRERTLEIVCNKFGIFLMSIMIEMIKKIN